MPEMEQRDKDICLDALALIACAESGDKQSFELLLDTIEEDEYQRLVAAVIGHAVAVLRLAARDAHVPPERVIAAVRHSLIFSDPPSET